MDETHLNFQQHPSKVLSSAGDRNVPGKTVSSLDGVTVLHRVNATDDKIPPFLIGRDKTGGSFNTHEMDRDNDIMILTIPALATHCLCHLDRCIFVPFKIEYGFVL